MEAVARGVLGAAAELVGDVDPLGAKLGDGAQDDVVLLARPRGALALGHAGDLKGVLPVGGEARVGARQRPCRLVAQARPLA